MSHESTLRHAEAHAASPRHFGWLLAVLAAVLAAWAAWQGSPRLLLLACMGCAGLLLLAERRPALLRRPLALWMALGALLGRVVNPLLLGLIWLTLFTPLALWFRLIGRDALHRRPDAGVDSYWIARDRRLDLGARMRRPF